LEAIQRVGLGGAVLFNAAQDLPQGPVRFASTEWRDLFKHTVTEAQRLGLEIDLHNAPGWSGSGGPWITPELGMQMLVCTRTNLIGPAHFHTLLPPIRETNGWSLNVATLAFPAVVGEGGRVPGFGPKISASVTAGFQGTNLLDGNSNTTVALPVPTPRQPQFLQLEFAQPFTASILKLTGAGKPQRFEGVLQVSDDGRKFREVRKFIKARPELKLEFDAVTARFFRLLFSQAEPGVQRLEFSELELAPIFRIDLARAKSGLGRVPTAGEASMSADVPAWGTIALTNILELSSKVDRGGRLEWDVPPGTWTVLHFASVPIGLMNHPAPLGGLGLECDKLSKEAIEEHFNGFLAKLLDEVGPEAGHAFGATHIDSWEIGYQNWTPRFREEFQRRRGYDPLPYLPATTGRIVQSLEQSERFLWDMRRTIADLLADNYAGHLADLAHRRGLQLSIEAYGSSGSGPFDDLQYAGRADVPMTEFWLQDGSLERLNLKSMPSAAHTYGKPITAAEAFTSYPASANWRNHPFSLKPLADAAFCEGVNRLVFHCYAHQPWLDRRPGFTVGALGIHYERTETWWEQSKAWHEYLARCQFFLQQGHFAADLCYLTDEGAFTTPPPRAELKPTLPSGYDYDLATPEVVLNRMTVKGGKLQLPDGLNYRLLVLPPSDRMTPTLLRKVKELVEAGATVLGPRPTGSPSLTDYPQCDMEVSNLANDVWGPCDGQRVKEHAVGRGRIIWGRTLEEVLTSLELPPDFMQLTARNGHLLRWIHRRLDQADVYFVSNPNSEPSQTGESVAECQFRVAGKQPEIWRPDTGAIEKPAFWDEEHGCTVVPLKFDPAGSLFVVFREPAPKLDPVQSATCNGRSEHWFDTTFASNGQVCLLAERNGDYQLKTVSGKILKAQITDLPKPVTVTGTWDLHFPPNSGAPEYVKLEHLISWTEHPDSGVKYFSGTATYTMTLKIPDDFFGPNRRMLLDLGAVQVIAELKVNGHGLGILWKPPFVADISEAAKAGDNSLEIRVVNLWPNRLIGDEQLPDDCQWLPPSALGGQAIAEWPEWLLAGKPSPAGRLTFTTWKHWTRNSPLLDSGLLGPVTLRAAERVTLE
jgi:hypothetical protein